MAEGAVLVIGGCGFVGFHVVEALLGEKTWPSVHVMSRNPARNQLAGAFYHVGDMTSTDKVRTLLDEIRPSVIIHTASPVALGNAEDWQYWYRTNVGGTKNVLDCAAASTYVKAFVYTSSVSVIDKATFDYVDENAPMATITSKLSYYSKSKALADQYVLDSNNKTGLRTTCLRITSVYGPRDNQMIPSAIQALMPATNANRLEITPISTTPVLCRMLQQPKSWLQKLSFAITKTLCSRSMEKHSSLQMVTLYYIGIFYG